MASSKIYLSPTSLPLKIPSCKGHCLVLFLCLSFFRHRNDLIFWYTTHSISLKWIRYFVCVMSKTASVLENWRCENMQMLWISLPFFGARAYEKLGATGKTYLKSRLFEFVMHYFFCLLRNSLLKEDLGSSSKYLLLSIFENKTLKKRNFFFSMVLTKNVHKNASIGRRSSLDCIFGLFLFIRFPGVRKLFWLEEKLILAAIRFQVCIIRI